MTDVTTHAIADFLLARYDEEEQRTAAVYPPGQWSAARVDDLPGTRFVMAPPPPRGTRQYDQGDPDDEVWVIDSERADVIVHIAEWCPERVLVEIAAKRRIVERYADLLERGDTGDAAWVLSALVQPYATHPAFNDEWAVDGLRGIR